MADVIEIRMQTDTIECHVCGVEAPMRWGVPIWNGSVVANDWPGETGGVSVCRACWEKHERGDLVEVPTSEYAAIFDAPAAGGGEGEG